VTVGLTRRAGVDDFVAGRHAALLVDVAESDYRHPLRAEDRFRGKDIGHVVDLAGLTFLIPPSSDDGDAGPIIAILGETKGTPVSALTKISRDAVDPYGFSHSRVSLTNQVAGKGSNLREFMRVVLAPECFSRSHQHNGSRLAYHRKPSSS